MKVKYENMWEWWCSNAVIGSFWVGVCKTLGGGEGDFSRFVIFEVSDGFKIRFWHDEWCGDQTLKAAFSML